jgi:hypothetical protein
VVAPVIPRPPLEVSPLEALPLEASPLEVSPPPRPRTAIQRQGWWRSLPQPRNPRLWGLGAGSLALGLVNGALVISAGVGLVAYQQLLQLSPRQRKGLMQRLQQGLPLPATPQQQALVLGLVAGASTYTFSALWHSTHSLLMALLLTGQGALALFAVGALLRSSRSPDRSRDLWDAAPLIQVDHNLSLLSHPDPLKRLVAVRRLVRMAQTDEAYTVGVSVRSHLIDCFTIRLGQESEAIVRSALAEGCNLLQPTEALAPRLATPFAAAPLPQPAPTEVVPPETAPPETAPTVTLPDEPVPTAGTRQLDPVASAPLQSSTDRAAPAPPGRRPVEYVEYLDI